MPRNPHPPGTAGVVRVYPTSAGYRARTTYRDLDGRTREVQRHGRSQAEAKRNLAVALRDRTRPAGAEELTGAARLEVLAELWFARLEDRSPQTLRNYRDRLDNQIIPSLGQLRLGELTVAIVDRHLAAVRDKNGSAIAKLVRTVLSGMCRLACRYGAMASNPCRDASRIAPKGRKRSRLTLDAAQIRQLRALLTYDLESEYRDLRDLIDFMIATGCRIGEACGLTWGAVDLCAGMAAIRTTVIRVPGEGLILREGTKTSAGVRNLELPGWMADTLEHRRGNHAHLVFPSELGHLRDPSNTSRDLKLAFRRVGWDGLTSHAFRRSVATMMDQAGLTARAAADQLGHSKVSVTQDHYFGRRVRSTGAASILETVRFGG